MMEVWKSWFRGNVNDFHFYNVKLSNGKTSQKERRTLNMPKKVCEDFSKLLWSEKVEIKLDNKKATKRLWEVLDSKENAFSINFPKFLEKEYALGTMATIEYQKDGKTIIDYVDGDVILPYKYTNSYIYGLITVSRSVEGSGSKTKYFTHLTYHEFENEEYKKINEIYMSKNEHSLGKELSFADIYPDIKEFEIIKTKNPRFQVWKLPITNNFDTDSPMGISILANQIDKFKSIDTKYDSFDREFTLGKRRILIDKKAIKARPEATPNGEVQFVSYFDVEDDVYVAIDGMEQQPLKDIDFSLRTQEHIDSINAELNYLSSGVGLGTRFYKFDNSGVKTATEVISENSDTYRTKVHHQIPIYDCLYDLVACICEMEGIKYKEISITFDDSIVQDEDGLIKRGLELLTNGVISKEKFMKKYLHYEDTEITEELEKIEQENKLIKPEGMDFFGMNKESEQQEAKTKTTLNGAQITSLMSVISMIKQNIVSRNEGLSIITSTLGIDRETAEQFVAEQI